MCTLAWGEEGNSLWICFNRDELRIRPPAEPPAIHHGTGPAAVYARDPQGGGTWFAASQSGFAVALLNHYPTGKGPLPHHTRSRGLLVVDLVETGTPQQAGRLLQSTDLAAFSPFCLFILSPHETNAFAWDGEQLQPLEYERPFWTTSSYKPEEVLAWRTGWWLARVENRNLDQAEASRLMRQAWPENPACGLTMDRVDARTLSQIQLELAPAGLTFAYRERETEGSGYGQPSRIQLPA